MAIKWWEHDDQPWESMRFGDTPWTNSEMSSVRCYSLGIPWVQAQLSWWNHPQKGRFLAVAFPQYLSCKKIAFNRLNHGKKKYIYLSITHGQLGFTNITHGDNCCKYSLGRREWRSCWEVFFWSIVFHRVLVSGIFSSSKPPFSERAMHITMKQQGAFGRCPLPRLPQGRIGENPYHRAPPQLSTYFELPSGNLLHTYWTWPWSK